MDKSKGFKRISCFSVFAKPGWLDDPEFVTASSFISLIRCFQPVDSGELSNTRCKTYERGGVINLIQNLFILKIIKNDQIKSCSWICSVISYPGKIAQNVHLPIPYPGSTAQGGGGSFKNRKPIGEIGCRESPMAEQKHWWIELSNCVTD